MHICSYNIILSIISVVSSCSLSIFGGFFLSLTSVVFLPVLVSSSSSSSTSSCFFRTVTGQGKFCSYNPARLRILSACSTPIPAQTAAQKEYNSLKNCNKNMLSKKVSQNRVNLCGAFHASFLLLAFAEEGY